MLEHLARHKYYCFLDGFSGYFHIPIALKDQEKTTFTCPYGTFAYKRMPFGLCNAPATFPLCMTAIFHELIEDNMEVFIDDFSVFRSSFDHYLKNLEKMLKRSVIKKGAENLTVDHLSRLENPDLGKLTKAEIRDLFLEERLMTISDNNNEPCIIFGMSHSYSSIVLKESYEGASLEMRQYKSFHNIIVAHQEGVMVSLLLREMSLKLGSTSHISFVTHEDFMGPFHSSNGNKYVLVAIDYMSKLVEAQSFPTNDARNVVNFLKKLFVRFGIPKALISDMGTHFCNYQMEREMKRYGVIHRFSIAYHPQTNGQVENTNRAIKRILEKTIRNNRKEWSHKLDDALWAFWTAFKPPLGTILFRIIYGKACHLLLELEQKAYWTIKSYGNRRGGGEYVSI
ncbi:reverse transcriptase domain-containing protein [Tanacetum coccineum]